MDRIIRSGGIWHLAAIGLASLICGCASLPTDQTAAFHTVASAARSDFANLSHAETAAVQADQLARVAEGSRRLKLAPECFAATNQSAACVIKTGDPADPAPEKDLVLTSRTQHLQKLVTTIADYAGAMADLAQAKDLADADTAATKAADSVKTLAAMVGPVGVAAGPVLDALVFARKQFEVRKRRALLLRVASAADPVVAATATLLGAETTQLRASLIEVSQTRLVGLKTQYDTDRKTPTLSPGDRATLLADIVQSANDLTGARAIETDFSSLAKTHTEVVNILRNPKLDIGESIAQAEAFATVVQSLAEIKGPTAKANP